jgi:hypothetical protein
MGVKTKKKKKAAKKKRNAMPAGKEAEPDSEFRKM